MSQMSSTRASSSGVGTQINTIIADSGTATPSGGVVNIVGSTNIQTNESANNAIISLKDEISFTTTNVGHINFDSNFFINNTFSENIVFTPNGTGKVNIPSINANSHAYVDGNTNYISSYSGSAEGKLLIGRTNSTAPLLNSLSAGNGISIEQDGINLRISKTNGSGWVKYTYAGNDPVAQLLYMEAGKNYILNATFNGGATDTLDPIFAYLPPSNTLSRGMIIRVVLMGPSSGFVAVRSSDQKIIWSQYPNFGRTDQMIGNPPMSTGSILGTKCSDVDNMEGNYLDYGRTFQSIAFLVLGTGIYGYNANDTIFYVMSVSRAWQQYQYTI